jgi:hypothetical protein
MARNLLTRPGGFHVERYYQCSTWK